MLTRVPIPSSVDRIPVPTETTINIRDARRRIQQFQDRWDRPQIEQFVAADYELVWQTLRWLQDSVPLIGQRLIEWGCGFAVVSAMAAELGFEVIGIEAESDLLSEGRKTLRDWPADLELVHGNFLPDGAERLAEDPTLPSLGHPVPEAYPSIGLNLDDFAIVYSYPWPGEDDFHERVFNDYADTGALLVQFCGPNDIRCWRKKRSN
ncbi:MAG: class I SAM-dependent methyltransferase [Planctomycetota bacterium]